MDKKKTPETSQESPNPIAPVDGEASRDAASLTDFIDLMNRIAFARTLARTAGHEVERASS